MTRFVIPVMFATLALPSSARAQDPREPPSADARIQLIVRERPPEMEAAARALVYAIAPNRVSDGGQPLIVIDGVAQPTPVPVLDQLKAANPDAYWHEVATLATQFEMFQRVVPRDSARARTMSAMFATEFEARILQRGWRGANEADRRAMRAQLEALMTRHFDAEDQLRALEVRDIERRLADVRAETERRRQRRAEMVRWSVDDIIHGAERPDF